MAKKVLVNVRLEEPLKATIDDVARRRGVSITELVRQAITDALPDGTAESMDEFSERVVAYCEENKLLPHRAWEIAEELRTAWGAVGVGRFLEMDSEQQTELLRRAVTQRISGNEYLQAMIWDAKGERPRYKRRPKPVT